MGAAERRGHRLGDDHHGGGAARREACPGPEAGERGAPLPPPGVGARDLVDRGHGRDAAAERDRRHRRVDEPRARPAEQPRERGLAPEREREPAADRDALAGEVGGRAVRDQENRVDFAGRGGRPHVGMEDAGHAERGEAVERSEVEGDAQLHVRAAAR
jgi:hypothetical protein